ncbi:MAG: GntR family transcriptional regulator, partial [Clostridiaceae bacterium]|nr:GntR family transcriptional regulator [Clostridiaceae bacterium]
DHDLLPPEIELANDLGISRTQLRDGLAILEQNGFITRRRGVGAVINRHIVNINTRIDLELEFLDMVEQAGYVPGVKTLGNRIITGNKDIAEKLGVSPASMILAIEKVITADDKPAIFCIDHIAFEKIRRFDYSDEELSLPIFYFIENYCQTQIYMDITEIIPVNADEQLGELFNIPVGQALLYLDEIAYNDRNEIILYSKEYYVNGILNHYVLRKKI